VKTAAQVFGQSMAFPPQVGKDGRIQWSSGPANIRESIEIILKTELQERIYLPDFGGGLRTYLFEPNTVTTRSQIEDRISESITRWEPRASLISVEVEQDPDDETTAIATVQYRLVATQTSAIISFRVGVGG